MFIGRARELASLNKLYDSGKFEFVVLYGRRRVGKTALINHFIDGKPTIYFMGVESNAKQNLENFKASWSMPAAMMGICLSSLFRLPWKWYSGCPRRNA